MYVDGTIKTSGEKRRVHGGLYGVRCYDRAKTDFGYTLFSTSWSDRLFLMDMAGLVVHTWKVTHSNVSELHDDGTLFTHNCGSWLEKLAPDSSVLWRWEGEDWMRNPNHHDYAWVSDDEIYSLCAVDEGVKSGLFPAGREPEYLRSDVIVRINKNKKIEWRFSITDHFEALCALSGLSTPIPYNDPYKLNRVGETTAIVEEPQCPADWAHANTIEYLPDTPLGRRDSRFKQGNLLFSLRAVDIIGIIDPEKDSIVWAWGPGVLDGQHQPTMLPDGNILIFDNGTYRGYSVIRELNPESGEEVWQYKDSERFFSPFRSGNQRLPNGNTFICECDAGRLFEVTPEGETVWSFYNPFIGEGPHHLGKRMHRAVRYTPKQVEALLATRTDKIVSEVDDKGSSITDLSGVLASYQEYSMGEGGFNENLD